MFMLRSTHEKRVRQIQDHLIDEMATCQVNHESARGAQKGLLRLQRRYKKLNGELESWKEDFEYTNRILQSFQRHLEHIYNTYDLETIATSRGDTVTIEFRATMKDLPPAPPLEDKPDAPLA